MRMWMVLLLLPGPVLAGPNENGVLILHAKPSLVFTVDHGSYCGLSELTRCEDAVVRVDGASTFLFYVFAAFPLENEPCLWGLTFGVEYDEAVLTVVGFGSCGNYELSDDDWPSSGEGTAVIRDENQTEHLSEVYWFAAYAEYYAEPASFVLGPHPTQGGNFVENCTVIGELDDITAYGRLGFNMDGDAPCPPGPVPAVSESWGHLKGRYR